MKPKEAFWKHALTASQNLNTYICLYVNKHFMEKAPTRDGSGKEKSLSADLPFKNIAQPNA